MTKFEVQTNEGIFVDEKQNYIDNDGKLSKNQSEGSKFMSFGSDNVYGDVDLDFQEKNNKYLSSKKKGVTFGQDNSFVDPVLQRVFQEFSINKALAEQFENDEVSEHAKDFETRHNNLHNSRLSFTHDDIDQTAVEIARIKAQSSTVLALIVFALFMGFVAFFVYV